MFGVAIFDFVDGNFVLKIQKLLFI